MPGMVTGVRADVAVKLFGDDLAVLIEKANQIAAVAATVRGMRDAKVDRVGGQQYLNISIDRPAIARYGLNASDVHDIIETAIAGKSATGIYEGERRFQAIVRLPESLRDSVQDVSRLLLTTPDGVELPLEDVARIQVNDGPARINRDMGKRRIVFGVNVVNRDLGGFVAELQRKVRKQVTLPAG
jgi:cobalt-zinc-cadmium resistance protein CzcA